MKQNRPESKSKSYKGKTGKRGNQRDFKERSRDRVVPETNDVGWYTNNKLLYTSAANLSFNSPNGDPLHLTNSNVPGVLGEYTFPGVMAFNVEPVLGGGDGSDPLMDSIAQDQYAMVRHANSGHSNYDPADLLLYYLATTQLYDIYGYLTRVYGAINLFNGLNRYMPSVLCAAMGINYNDMIKHISDLRAYIANYRAKISQFYLPGVLPIYQRSIHMFSKIYVDSPLAKAQLYVFTPSKLWKFDNTTGTLTGTTFAPSGANLTFDQLVARVESYLTPLLGNEDTGIMSGDVLKCYGQGGCAIPADMPFDYSVVPEFDMNILAQIENMWIFGETTSNMVQQIVTPEGTYMSSIVQRVVSSTDTNNGKAEYQGPCLSKYLNMHSDIPTPEAIMEASRWMFNARYKDGTAANQKIVVLEDSDFFICAKVSVYFRYWEDSMVSTDVDTYTSSLIHEMSYAKAARFVPFGARPQLWVCSHDQGGSLIIKGCFHDVDNWALADSVAIHKMNSAAKMGQFRFPLRG